MRIQLHELRRQPEQNLDFYEEVDLSKVHPNVEDEASVHVKADARYSEGLYVLDGQLSTTLKLKCSKCLTTYDWPLTADWHDVFSQEEPPDAEDEDETDIHFVRGDELELSPYIQEELLLHIPFVPVCREDCRGLCPTCGVNRNEQSCDCKQEHIDPRLAELQKFFSSGDNA